MIKKLFSYILEKFASYLY